MSDTTDALAYIDKTIDNVIEIPATTWRSDEVIKMLRDLRNMLPEAEPMVLWRCLYEELGRDCDGTYLLPPVYVLASHEDDAWNAADTLLQIPDWCTVTGVVEARHATEKEAAEWQASRKVEVTDEMVEKAAQAIYPFWGERYPSGSQADEMARAALSTALGGGDQ